MIEHILFAKVAENRIAEMTEALAQFSKDISEALPGVGRCTSGPNFNPASRAAGYTHGLYVKIADEAALTAYLACPRHQALIQQLNALQAERFALDYFA